MDARSARRTTGGDVSEHGEVVPQLGDVVEYVLSATVLAQQDQQGNDRTKGEPLHRTRFTTLSFV